MIKILSTEEFIRELKRAPEWMMTEEFGTFLLTVRENGEEKQFFSPDPLGMSDTEFRIFLSNLQTAREMPAIQRNRFL